MKGRDTWYKHGVIIQKHVYIYINTRRYLKESTSKQKPQVLERFFIGCITVPTKTINNQRSINVVILILVGFLG